MTVGAASSSYDPSWSTTDRIVPGDEMPGSATGGHKLPIFAENDEISFKDILDVINPLQHLPIISTIYRELTGDEPGAGSRLAGAALYGGPIGLLGELVNCSIADNTGKDVGGHIYAFLADGFSDPAPVGGAATAIVQADQPSAQPNSQAQAAAKTAEQTPTATEKAEPAPAEPAPKLAVAAEPPSQAVAGTGTGDQGASQAKTETAGATGNPMPLERGSDKFMPVPARRPVQTVMPPVAQLPVSHSGQKSHLPVTGRAPMLGLAPTSASLPPALAAQANASGAAQGTLATPPAPGVPAAKPGDTWFSASMIQALEKYQRSGKLNAAGQTETVQ